MSRLRKGISAKTSLRAGLLAGASVAAIVASGLGATSAVAAPACTGGNIVGAGSSLQKLAQQNVWAPAFAAEVCNSGKFPTVTYESIGRLLPGRETIIVTRNQGYVVEGAHVVGDIDVALTLAGSLAADGEIISAGGGEIYAQTIGRADRLFITEVDLAPEGEARFPAIDRGIWREIKRERPERTERDDADLIFVDYERR